MKPVRGFLGIGHWQYYCTLLRRTLHQFVRLSAQYSKEKLRMITYTI
jgi:hypothetical protein